MRVGFGYDVHAFAPNRELWLGGIRVPAEQGLLGHSDADVLIHALCDALLGAAAMRDIGYHFPPVKVSIDTAPVASRLNDVTKDIGSFDCTVFCTRLFQIQIHRVGQLVGLNQSQNMVSFVLRRLDRLCVAIEVHAKRNAQASTLISIAEEL